MDQTINPIAPQLPLPSVVTLAEGLILVFLFLYLLFAVLVVRQTQLLNHTLETSISPLIKLVGVLHFCLALIAFFVALSLI